MQQGRARNHRGGVCNRGELETTEMLCTTGESSKPQRRCVQQQRARNHRDDVYNRGGLETAEMCTTGESSKPQRCCVQQGRARNHRGGAYNREEFETTEAVCKRGKLEHLSSSYTASPVNRHRQSSHYKTKCKLKGACEKSILFFEVII